MSASVILQTSDGTWKWWEALQIVSFYSNGKHRQEVDVSLPLRNNHLNGAVIAACKAEIKRRKGMPK